MFNSRSPDSYYSLNIPCPSGSRSRCPIPNCIFRHDDPLPAPSASLNRQQVPAAAENSHFAATEDNKNAPEDGARKRRRVQHEAREDQAAAPSPYFGGPASRHGGSSTQPRSTPSFTPSPFSPPSNTESAKARPAGKPSFQQQNYSLPTATLNPRMIAKPPTSHGTRKALLDLLHESMRPLNDRIGWHKDARISKLRLNDDDLIRWAVDEEQRFAEDEPLVYSNVIKHRIAAFKKMKLEEYIKLRQDATQNENGKEVEPLPAKPPPPPIETGLTSTQEVSMLSRLITPQAGLDEFGYVTSVPSEEDIQKAKDGVESAHGGEECDRCDARFQVFPDRREDGTLTTGGKCVHHWGRKTYPPRAKGSTSSNEPHYSCCQSALGTEGCTTVDTHVFKVSEAKRLASILPFIATPYNPNARTDRAICFDCEMGYTVYGLELIRLSATAWPSGECVLDVLVRPRGTILDLNTRFSGVTPELFSNAPAYDPTKTQNLADSSNLVLVPSPEVARSLLCNLISSDTPVLGHALENDLRSIRLVHPNIVDTILLYPHPHGLPSRLALRNLASRYLQREIQTAGAAGHDSLEDSRTAGDLVRLRIKKKWAQMQQAGWTLENGSFKAPPPGYTPPLPDRPILTGPRDNSYNGGHRGSGRGRGKGNKRRFSQMDGACDGMEEEEEEESGDEPEEESSLTADLEY